MNKKRWLVIAIALFLVIGTSSFVFANPSDTSLNGKGTTDPNSSSQSNSSNSNGTKDNNNTIQNDGSFNTGENDANGENIIVNGDLNSNTMGNPINGNTTTNTSQKNNNNNAGQNNPSNIANGGNNSQDSSGNNGNNNGNTNNDNDNNNSGNTGGGNSGGSSNPGNKPIEPENPDVVDPSPSTPDDEKPISNFVFANQKSFTENKIEIQDPNYVSMTVRNLSKTNDKGYTTTDRIVEINEYDTFKFTVCYRNLPTCQIYIMTHVR